MILLECGVTFQCEHTHTRKKCFQNNINNNKKEKFYFICDWIILRFVSIKSILLYSINELRYWMLRGNAFF